MRQDALAHVRNLAIRQLLNLTMYLPPPLRWFRPGKCNLCGRWGWVFWETGEHEECWLELK